MTSTSSYSSSGATWQDRLEEVCRGAKLGNPVFQVVSDRRGGRTAWSIRVTVQGKTLPARYWYDGKNLNNAREDAAECAVNWLSTVQGGSASQTWNSAW